MSMSEEFEPKKYEEKIEKIKDRKSKRLNSSQTDITRMPSSA